MIPQALIHYVETEIIPRYEHFDKAHNRSHVQTVIDESLALAELYPQADERLVYTIAAYHDTGLCRDRATHHLVSGEIIAADSNLLQWFDKEEMAIMREAVEDHRASSDMSRAASTEKSWPKPTVSSTQTSPCAVPYNTD